VLRECLSECRRHAVTPAPERLHERVERILRTCPTYGSGCLTVLGRCGAWLGGVAMDSPVPGRQCLGGVAVGGAHPVVVVSDGSTNGSSGAHASHLRFGLFGCVR
jgi:hypothetical protein